MPDRQRRSQPKRLGRSEQPQLQQERLHAEGDERTVWKPLKKLAEGAHPADN